MSNTYRDHIDVGRSINELTEKCYKRLVNNAVSIPSRNGDCRSLYEYTYRLTDPTKRHLNLVGRKSNIFQLIGETLWVLSGSGKVTGYLETLMPRAPQYSDDGVVWRAAYGPRLFAYNQLIDVIKFFERDGKMTRRAVVSIFFPEYDTFTQLEKDGLSDSKDFSCNNLMYFYVTPDDRFHLKVTNRSNDSVFGQGINITEFSVIQELIFHKVRLMHPELTLGDLTISSNNFHAYDSTFDQVQSVCSIEQKPFVDYANKPLCSPGIDIGEARKMLGVFIDYCETINSESNVCFKSSGEFQFGDYLEMTERYFLQKAGAIVPPLDIRNYQEDLLDAIYNSSFRKFEVIV